MPASHNKFGIKEIQKASLTNLKVVWWISLEIYYNNKIAILNEMKYLVGVDNLNFSKHIENRSIML